MARLPSERYLIQQIDGLVILFEDFTEQEIVRFDPTDANATARAQHTIHLSELGDEDKCFAHFWSGYFHAHATLAVGGWANPIQVPFLPSPDQVVVVTPIRTMDTTHLHEHDPVRAEDKTYESRLH